MSDPPPPPTSAPDDGDLPFLPDPYYVHAPTQEGGSAPRAPHSMGTPEGGPGPRPPGNPHRGVTTLALSSLVAALLMGPVGAILAMVFGWYARREIEREGGRRAAYAMATAGLVLGVVMTPVWGAGLSYFAWTRIYRGDVARSAAIAPAVPVAPPAPDPPAAVVAPTLPLVLAPAHTQVDRAGRITVVDLGRATASLADELPRQRAAATTAGDRLVLMTITGGCAPCRGVDEALRDPLMQTALSRVRLVRVDAEVFHEDLEALRIPHARVPGFFLLAPDLSPRDGIDGGEWDADVPPNMAPVLGAFVRGQYAARREAWRPLPGSGMAL